MKKKLIIFLTISFLVFLVTLYFQREKQKKIEEHIKQIESITTTIEQEELKDINTEILNSDLLTGSQLTWENSSKTQEKELEKIIANQLVDIENISTINNDKSLNERRYQKLYLQEMKKNNINLAIKSIKRLLRTTVHKDIWYQKIIDLYIKIWDFDNAEEYSTKLLKISPTKENLNRHLYIRFQNVNFFDEKQVADIKDLIIILYKKRILDSSEFSFYNFLIDLLKNWKVKNLDILLNALLKTTKNASQKQLLLSIKSDLEVYNNTKWTPLYYFKSLVALDLLKFGYFGLAKNIANQVYTQDSSYLLPKQILAYSYFFMWNYENAIKFFQELKDTHKDENEKDYIFFIWVSYYWTKNYENSLLFLEQLDNKYPYYLDVLRYKALSYMELWNNEKILWIIKEMLNYKLTYIDYYNLFKYVFTKCYDCYHKDVKTMVKFLWKCYKDVDNDREYVCWYWKWYFYNKFWKTKYTVKYFKLLTKYFQDPYLFEVLWDYYLSKWNKKTAKYYFLKELLYTSKEEKREKIKKKIKDIMMISEK